MSNEGLGVGPCGKGLRDVGRAAAMSGGGGLRESRRRGTPYDRQRTKRPPTEQRSRIIVTWAWQVPAAIRFRYFELLVCDS